MMRFSGVVLGLLLLAACDAGEAAAPSSPEVPEALTSTSSSSGAAPTAPAASGVPASANEMNDWLHTKAYVGWAKESQPHASTGPHASSVLTYMNATLEQSLASGATEHPVGSASVKEFLGPNGVKGWAAFVKTQAGDGGDAWYWYETFNTTPGSHGIEGQGKSLCVNCHLSGKDFVLTPFPLR